MSVTPADRIDDITVHDELKTSFLSYAMSVIVARALPDVRDGLKPVHRRILYSMEQMGLTPSKAYMKSARVVGEAMGKYHPHGDSAIYEALVRMAQDWSMRIPLVDGHGNFGSHADGPAASRYCLVGDTRLRLANGTSVLLRDFARENGLDSPGDAAVDETVLGRNGHPVRIDRVFHSGEHPVKRVTLTIGHSIAGTDNHPLLCLVNVAGVPMFQWLRMDEITPGVHVALPRTTTTTAEPDQKERQLGVLLGAWVAEGWASVNRAGFSNTDKRYFDEVLAAYDALVGGVRYTSERVTTTGKPLYELGIRNTGAFEDSPLAPLLGCTAADKFVPEAIFRGGMGVKRAFLQAAFEGNGGMTYGARNAACLTYTTYSPTLAAQMQELLLEFGVYVAVRRDKNRGAYTLVTSSRADVRAFARNVGFLYTKQERLEEFLSSIAANPRPLSGDYVPFVSEYVRTELAGRRGTGVKWARIHNFDRGDRWATNRELILATITDETVKAVITPIMDAGYRYVQVASVTEEPAEDVYSVRVTANDHAFLAGGFINHNTEARMAKAALAMVDELDEDTVDFAPNYDGSLQEPKVLPAAFPNLLVNGSEGIAVGMATKMAPHNLGEVVEACKFVLRNPHATIEDVIRYIPAPDLPTGAILLGLDGVDAAYRTGRGTFTMRAKTHVEDVTARKKGIVVTELPFQVGPEAVIEAIKKQRDLKRLNGVANVVDLSDRKSGMRLVIECKTGFQPQAVLDELLRLTPLQTNFAIHNLALIDGQPRTLTLLDLVTHYVNHRREVTTRRCEFCRRKARDRAHILEGYLIAMARIDEVVAVIRKSKDTAEARTKLTKSFKLTEVQATAILEMPLRRLTSLEVEKVQGELDELNAQIKELTRLLDSREAMNDLIAAEMDAAVRTYGTPRRSQISTASPVVTPVNEAAARIPQEPCTVQVSATGLISHWTTPLTGARNKHDAVIAALTTDTHATIGALTSKGRVGFIPVMEVPAGGKDRGAPVKEFIDLEVSERVIALVPLDGATGVAMGTRNGVVKILNPAEMPKKSGQEIIGLKHGDEVVGASAMPGEGAELVFITTDAQLLRTPADGVRPQGRTGGGVAGVKLSDGATVITFAVVPAEAGSTPVTTVAGGVSGTTAKTTPLTQFPAKGRATAGVRAHRLLRGEDRLVAAAVGAVVGVAATGALVTLPTEIGKRDGAGVKTSTPVVGVATKR